MQTKVKVFQTKGINLKDKRKKKVDFKEKKPRSKNSRYNYLTVLVIYFKVKDFFNP